MTREKFVEKAVRAAEKELQLPPGWWGNWRNIYSPGGVVIRFSGRCWVVRSAVGEIVSKHDVRSSAIRKGKTL